jgi:small subunit ribosomal protein S6
LKNYEIMVIIDPKVENVKNVFERIKTYITSTEGEILKDEDMGVRRLEYLVKKREKGHYYLVEMKMDPKKLSEIENDIKVDEDVLRYLLTVSKNQA